MLGAVVCASATTSPTGLAPAVDMVAPDTVPEGSDAATGVRSTDLPDALVVQASASVPGLGLGTGSTAGPRTLDELPADVLGAYGLAVAAAPPRCHLEVPVLAAVGQVESGNLSGRLLGADHVVRPGLFGPTAAGTAYAVPDTDAGQWDRDATWDRAVGPMMLLPSTWRAAGVDLDGDGRRDPQDVYDAAGAVMVYLCSQHRDLATPGGLRAALLSFRRSPAYVDAVLGWKVAFEAPVAEVGSGATTFDAVLVGSPDGPAAATAARLVAPRHARSTVREGRAASPVTTAATPSVPQPQPGPQPAQVPPATPPPAPVPNPTPPTQTPTQTPTQAPTQAPTGAPTRRQGRRPRGRRPRARSRPPPRGPSSPPCRSAPCPRRPRRERVPRSRAPTR